MICTNSSIPLVSAAMSNSVLNAAKLTPVQLVFPTIILSMELVNLSPVLLVTAASVMLLISAPLA